MTTIPFTDLAAAAKEVWPSIEADYMACLFNAGYIGGSAVSSFEHNWATYCGASYGVGVANGTDALELTLTALAVGNGDEVIIPANTFIATAAAVIRAGAIPRFADVSDDTLLMTPQTLAAAITPRTRAVIIVHLYGQVPDMGGLLAVAAAKRLLVIEDAAQAHGAKWDGRKAGSFGVAACFSFYPGKNLGAFGDGGMVVTSLPDLAERVRSLANHGRIKGSSHYEHEYVGRNSRLDSLQAIALSGKLAVLDCWNERRIALAGSYRERLRSTPVRLVHAAPPAFHVYHLFVVRVPQRDKVRAELNKRGIQTGVHYPLPCHRQLPLKPFGNGPLPIAERSAGDILSLPLFPHMSEGQVEAVCDALMETLIAIAADPEPDHVQ